MLACPEDVDVGASESAASAKRARSCGEHAADAEMKRRRLVDEPTVHTTDAHKRACCGSSFDWEDRRDFEWASRGLIHRPKDPAIFDAEGRVVWHHTAFEDMLQGDAPTTVHPSLWRHAILNNYRGLFKVTDGVYQVRGESLANVTFVEGQSGYIVVDPLTTVECAAYALELLYKFVGRKPIVGMIYSHTHSDHFGGVKGMISGDDVRSGKCRVFAPADFLEWVLKEQGLAAEGMPSRNAYMYGENLRPGVTGIVDTGLGQQIEGGVVSFIEPTDVIPKEGKKVTLDGVDIEFMFAPGEAPTGMHCYFPKFRVLHCADNCYMCLHNVYTIRGAFPRDAMAWADSVARSLAFEDTEFLVSGHNWPVFGRAEVRRFLGQQRDGIRFMHDQTLRLMGHGYVPAEIANRIRFPPALARLWHLRPYYGSLVHNVRGIYAYYLGWYDGNPAHLDELPPRETARKTLEYMGGAEAVVAKARKDFEAGEYRWVAQVLDQVLWAEPAHAVARELAAATHAQLGYGSENPTWRNAYLSAAQELRHGLPKATKMPRALRDVLKDMPVHDLLNGLSVRLDSSRSEGDAFVLQWVLTDVESACHTELTNSVLINREGRAAAPDATVSLPRAAFNDLALGEIGSLEECRSRVVAIQGDTSALSRLLGMLDRCPQWFPIATHTLKHGERVTAD